MENIIAKGGEDLQGRTASELLFTMLGKDVATGFVDIYTTLITTKEALTLPINNLSGGAFDYTTVRTSDGSICGQVQTDEQDFSGEISLSFQEDYIYVNNNQELVQNKLTSLLKGDSINVGDTTIIPLGTNGTSKSYSSQATVSEMGQDFKYIFFNEGDKIKVAGGADPTTGAHTYRPNPLRYMFNRTYKTIDIEVRTTSSSGKQLCKMMPIVACTSIEWAEGDVNTFNVTLERSCDVYDRKDYFVEVDVDEAFPIDSSEITEARVDYFIIDDSSAVTVGEDEYALKIATDGTYSLVQGSTTIDISEKVIEGTRFKTTKIAEGATVTEVNAFAALKSETELANFSLSDDTARYYAKVKNFNRDTEEFEDYVSIDY